MAEKRKHLTPLFSQSLSSFFFLSFSFFFCRQTETLTVCSELHRLTHSPLSSWLLVTVDTAELTSMSKRRYRSPVLLAPLWCCFSREHGFITAEFVRRETHTPVLLYVLTLISRTQEISCQTLNANSSVLDTCHSQWKIEMKVEKYSLTYLCWLIEGKWQKNVSNTDGLRRPRPMTWCCDFPFIKKN